MFYRQVWVGSISSPADNRDHHDMCLALLRHSLLQVRFQSLFPSRPVPPLCLTDLYAQMIGSKEKIML